MSPKVKHSIHIVLPPVHNNNKDDSKMITCTAQPLPQSSPQVW